MKGMSALLAGILVTAALSVGPANAQLLGNLLDSDGLGDVVNDLLGDGDTSIDDLATVGGGPAGDGSLVNLGLGAGGGNNNNIADLNLGQGSNRLGNVNIGGGLLGGGGGSSLTAGLDLGGLGLDLTSPGLEDLLGGGNGGGGNGNGNGNGGGGGIRVSSLDGGSFGAICLIADGRKVLQMASNASVNRQAIAGWQSAANVRIVPIRLCPQARAQVAQIFGASGKIDVLRSAVMADALIVASLNRSRYDAGDVFAVERQGGELIVYVF